MDTYYGSLGSSDGIVLTPSWFMGRIEALGTHNGLDFNDPCPLDPQEDGLLSEWPQGCLNYVNPPYARGHIAKWVAKCAEEAEKGKIIALLIPAYSDTIYFHEHILDNPRADMIHMKGRMKFVQKDGTEHKQALPQPLVLVMFNMRLTKNTRMVMKHAKFEGFAGTLRSDVQSNW